MNFEYLIHTTAMWIYNLHSPFYLALCRCGHCKSLQPVIQSLAKLLHQRKRKYGDATVSAIPSLAGLLTSDEVVSTMVEAGDKEDVIVAQIDGSANDVHSLGPVHVNGFPTIVFARYVNGRYSS